eukprot:2834956-Pleurochrysis_carterae.AAC.1
MCHDFGTPVAVLKMLLSTLRLRLNRSRQQASEPHANAADLGDCEDVPDRDVAGGRGSELCDFVNSLSGSNGEQGGDAAAASRSSRASSRRSAGGGFASEDDAVLEDLIRRASAALELLEVTRQKAIAFARLEADGEMAPLYKRFNVAELMEK